MFCARSVASMGTKASFGKAAGADAGKRDHHPALEKDRQFLFKTLRKALFGGNADLLQAVGGGYLMEEDGLRRGRLHRYPAALLPVCAGLLDLGAAVGQAAADQPQLPDLCFNGGKLPLQKRQAAFGIVVLHMFPDLRQRKTDLLHD